MLKLKNNNKSIFTLCCFHIYYDAAESFSSASAKIVTNENGTNK